MKQSLRARRMAKQQRKSAQQARLNLVSLMDIFTIIVFFLLMNSADVEVLQTPKAITLPQSVASQKPESTLVIMVNDQQLVVTGEVVARVDEELAKPGPVIDGLARALQAHAALPQSLAAAEPGGQAVTIMGDEAVPYALLKKVMNTCAAENYRNLSLAVNKIESVAGIERAGANVVGG